MARKAEYLGGRILEDVKCQKCGHTEKIKNGFRYNKSQPYKNQQYKCKNCGKTYIETYKNKGNFARFIRVYFGPKKYTLSEIAKNIQLSRTTIYKFEKRLVCLSEQIEQNFETIPANIQQKLNVYVFNKCPKHTENQNIKKLTLGNIREHLQIDDVFHLIKKLSQES